MKGESMAEGLEFPKCCKDELDVMKGVLGDMEVAKSMLSGYVFADILFSNPAERVYKIGATDWEGLVGAVKGMNVVSRRTCARIAFVHSTEHPGGKLNQFWSKLHDIFNQ